MIFLNKSLAFADIIVAFFNILPQILWRKSVRFNIGNLECKFVTFSQVCLQINNKKKSKQ